MLSRALTMLALVGSMLLLLQSSPSTAHAQGCPTPFWGIYCKGYLHTPYGAVARATQVSGNGRARYGNYSPQTREFLPSTDWMPIRREQWFELWVHATDDYDGTFFGYASVVTAFGEASWGMQVQNLGDYGWVGRWGIYNFNSNLFYPDQTGRESWRAAD